MSTYDDVLANYEHTKRTCNVPPGWMLIEPTDFDPASVDAKFWLPTDQIWLDLKAVDGQYPAEFMRLHVAGATCYIVRDPNYVAPPPPPAATPMGFGAMGMPFATPTPAPTPMAMPISFGSAPAPTPVPVQVVVPVQPTVIPVLPTNPVVPAVVAPVFNPLAQMLPTSTSAPIAIPSIPVETTLGIQANAPSFNPVFVPESEESDENTVATSDADPNEVSAWWAAREGVKAQIDALEKVEAELRSRIVKTCFPDGLREGANKCALPDGRKLTITGVVNRTVDDALVGAGMEALQKHLGVAPVGLFKTKYEVSKAVLKTLGADAKALLANVITERNGSPQLKVSELK